MVIQTKKVDLPVADDARGTRPSDLPLHVISYAEQAKDLVEHRNQPTSRERGVMITIAILIHLGALAVVANNIQRVAEQGLSFVK